MLSGNNASYRFDKVTAMYLRRLILALALLTSTIHTPARAHGNVCDGLGVLICAPIFVITAIADALTPKSTRSLIYEALAAGDLEKLKQVLKSEKNAPQLTDVMEQATASYLHAKETENDTSRLNVIKYLLNGLVDVSAEKGSKYLQMTVQNGLYSEAYPTLETSWRRRLALANLLFAYGARATTIDLSRCYLCETENEFIPFLIANGVDLNSGKDRTLLEGLLRNNKLEAAKRLIRLGADPNGKPRQNRNMLYRLTTECNLDEMRLRETASQGRFNFETESTNCLSRVKTVIQLGADPNGQANPEDDCTTPYEIAKILKNDALADTLLELGATDDFGQRCRASSSKFQTITFIKPSPREPAFTAITNPISILAYSPLEAKINNGQFSEAQTIVQQGADPNGVIHEKRGMLYRLAAHCNLNVMRPRMSPTLFELEVGSCTNRIEFVIELGADPNGKATPDVDCTTPYEIAIKLENDALAKKLLELGATADFGERCRAGGK